MSKGELKLSIKESILVALSDIDCDNCTWNKSQASCYSCNSKDEWKPTKEYLNTISDEIMVDIELYKNEK